MPERKELIELLKKYRAGEASAEEVVFLEKYYAYFEKEEPVSNGMSAEEREETGKRIYKAIGEGVRRDEEAGSRESLVVSPSTPLRIKLWRRIAVAASIVGVLFLIGYWLLNTRNTTGDPSTIAQGLKTNDVKAPDKNRAQIKLADGTVVYLDSAANGQLALQGNVKLVKNASGEIVYKTTDDGPQTTVQYNTLFNPRGSKVQPLLLDDGTKVWLNAESSITYPTAFVSKERKVEITGEAYFEVAHNPAKPFIVSKGEMNVTVLGTHFNVNAYDDENAIKVTLLEGSVSVKQNAESKMLKPGQQAVAGSGELSVVSNANVEEAMAWKNGLFSFNGVDLKTIMREVSRWYDVETVFETPINEKFYVEVNRNTNVSTLFKMLEKTKAVHFKIEGKRIIVTQ